MSILRKLLESDIFEEELKREVELYGCPTLEEMNDYLKNLPEPSDELFRYKD